METQVSVTTQSASVTASSGSCNSLMAAPDALIQSVNGFFGASSGGVATRRLKSKRSAACIQEASTLLSSPLQATVRPRIGPRCSSKVITSAITWQGCDTLVRPLITGTVAYLASSASVLWSSV